VKTCLDCGEEKPESEFYRRRKRPYRRSVCKPCQRARVLRYSYGITPQDVVDMAKAQRYRCQICRRKCRLVVDHDHKTGKVRGLLCTPCNTSLGRLENNMKRTVKYLKGEL
jgi:hypothetical protein